MQGRSTWHGLRGPACTGAREEEAGDSWLLVELLVVTTSGGGGKGRDGDGAAGGDGLAGQNDGTAAEEWVDGGVAGRRAVAHGRKREAMDRA